MKEINENANSDLPKNDNFLPLISVGNKMKSNAFSKDNEFKLQNKDKINNQFYKTGKISIISFIIKKQQLGASSKLTMNLQV